MILVEFTSIAGYKMSLGTAIAWLTVPIDVKFRQIGSFFVFNPTTNNVLDPSLTNKV